MKNLQKTLLLVLSMVATQAVESTSDAGHRMMKKQACVSSLLPFFTKTEQYRFQELDKRVSTICEHVMHECKPGINNILSQIEGMDKKQRDTLLRSLEGEKFFEVRKRKLLELKEFCSLKEIPSHEAEPGLPGLVNVEIISHHHAQKEIDEFVSRLKNHKPEGKNWEYHMPIPNQNRNGCNVMVYDKLSNTVFVSGKWAKRKWVNCAQWKGPMEINKEREKMTKNERCVYRRYQTLTHWEDF